MMIKEEKHNNHRSSTSDGTNVGLAKMFKGGVIMDVTNVEQAIIAEKAGAVAVMALEQIPLDMIKSGKVCRMSDAGMIKKIIEAVTIPVMAKVRIGHTIEAEILQELKVDFIDESEVLTPADTTNHINKKKFKIPFVCGAKNLGESLRRINEGAAMIRTKGNAGTGDVSEAVRHINLINEEINQIKEKCKSSEQISEQAIILGVPPLLLSEVISKGRLPVVNFGAGGIVTPADAALMMTLGCDGVFVGSGIFTSENPEKLAKAIVDATTYYDNPKMLLQVSMNLGGLMPGKCINKRLSIEQTVCK